jgi:predicted DNA-binding protein (MmcQ/YjbR family)
MIETPREKLTKSEAALRDLALKYPETHEDFPWGHRALKVKGKVFVFMGAEEGATSMSFKLPKSAGKAALKNSFASPTHYGMGKHGWVTVAFDLGDSLPMDLLRGWIDESYRAVAPKRVLAQLVSGHEKPKTAKATVKRRRA